MRVGFCTRYYRHEATYAAVRVADWAAARGDDISFFSPRPETSPVAAQFDRYVFTGRQTKFTDWAAAQDAVVWTHIPPIEQIQWARARGIRTIILVLAGELDPGTDRELLHEVDALLCPLHLAAAHVHLSTGVPREKLFISGWDVGLPMVRKYPLRGERALHLLLPLYDGVGGRCEGTALEIFGRTLAADPRLCGTVLYTASTLAAYAGRRLRDFVRYFPDRVNLVSGLSPSHRPLIFQAHDLTLWPTHMESTCMVGLTSVTCGTPVVAFASPATTECFGAHNAVLVPTPTVFDQTGWPQVKPDYKSLEHVLRAVLADRPGLTQLQQTVLHGLAERRKLFCDTLARVFHKDSP